MFLLGLALSVLIGISLGFFGGGGSILTVPLLVYVFGLEPKQAIAGSLLIVGVASISGAAQHGRSGNLRLREGLLFGVASMPGAYLGGRASAFLDGGLLLLLFAAMMMLTGSAMWRGRGAAASGATNAARAPMRLGLQGFAVGSFTGLVGAGGGFLIVPALALWAGLPIAAAVGTSLAIIVINCAAGFLGYVNHVDVPYDLVAAVTAVAVGGSFLGSRLATRIDPAELRRAFAGFVLAMSVVILAREGALVASTVGPALPATWPQVVFAFVMLGIGIFAGRSSKAATRQHADLVYQEGAGI